MAIEDLDRRTLLRLGGVAAVTSLAGCGGQSNGTLTESTETDAPTATSTPTESDGGGSDRPPGADQLGGPDDLQASATVEATTLDADQGAGQNVFTPAVVWVEQGATALDQILREERGQRPVHVAPVAL
jgi:hypothetical protein